MSKSFSLNDPDHDLDSYSWALDDNLNAQKTAIFLNNSQQLIQ